MDPPAVGPRRSALKERARESRKRRAGAAVLGGIAIALATFGSIVVLQDDERSPAPEQSPIPTPTAGDDITRTLIYGTSESQPERDARWVLLLTYDEMNSEGSIVYIPSHTAVDVPGRGLQALGRAAATGGAPLVVLSAENLLGVSIDRYLELSDSDARVLFGALGPLTVEVPAEVRVRAGKDRAELLFAEGNQRLPGSFLVRLLYTVGLDGDDAELGGRHLAFWSALLESYRDDPIGLSGAFEASHGAIGESDATAAEHGDLLASLASLDPLSVTIAALPVSQVSAGGAELYSVDGEELASFVTDVIGTDPSDIPPEARIQLLNGNGVPGIGQEAARLLVGHGFRVFLTGNAQRLDHEKTLVITYDDSPEGVDLARRARELLGVGEVQISAQQQGIVDLTVVIGEDFLRAH